MGKLVEQDRQSLYCAVTDRIFAELEEGRLPWLQPWDSAACGCAMPANAASGRGYSGINILILWVAVIDGRFASQRWLTFRQAQAAGRRVRRDGKGVTVCYADRFTLNAEPDHARDDSRDARTIAFFKRLTLFNVAQCHGLPEAMTSAPVLPAERDIAPHSTS